MQDANLKTFLALRNHRLAVRINDKKQWLILSTGVKPCEFDFPKRNGLSPVFSTKEDAKTAQSEIGEENLRKMFNSF